MSDFYLGNIFGLQAFNFVKEFEPSEPARNAINKMLGIYTSALQQKLYPVFANGGAQYVQTGQEATLANRQYEVMLPNGEWHYAETACATFGVSESVHSNTGTMLFNEWVCPFMILYSGKTKAFFDRDYAVYRFIMDNMKAQNEFTFVNNKYGSEIQNAVFNRLTQENIAMTQAKAAAMMKERSTSYRTAGESSGFDWGKEWGDYIYDRNTYRTEDGGTIQASTSADGVWKSGNRFYAGSAGSAPYGWQQLPLNR
ncbi:MAG: hypothetical protein Q4G69_07045 [Planctomycetia bacterium]|nr:hypothetical protein [Planctomycetia bacterium]